jgi:hypothetical protein
MVLLDADCVALDGEIKGWELVVLLRGALGDHSVCPEKDFEASHTNDLVDKMFGSLMESASCVNDHLLYRRFDFGPTKTHRVGRKHPVVRLIVTTRSAVALFIIFEERNLFVQELRRKTSVHNFGVLLVFEVQKDGEHV